MFAPAATITIGRASSPSAIASTILRLLAGTSRPVRSSSPQPASSATQSTAHTASRPFLTASKPGSF